MNLKKRLLIALLCAGFLVSCVSCDHGGEATDSTPSTTASLESSHPDEEGETLAFARYEDLLKTYTELRRTNGEADFRDAHPILDEREEAILQSLLPLCDRTVGYCMLDVDKDGEQELLLLDPERYLHALYTLKDGVPVFVKSFCESDSGVYNGKLYDHVTVREGNLLHHTVYVGRLVRGKYVEEERYGYTYHADIWESDGFFLFQNGKEVQTDEQTVRTKMSFPSFPTYSGSAGVSYTPILEGQAEVLQEDPFYRITETDDGAYELMIFDGEGNPVHTERFEKKVYCYASQNILHFGDTYSNAFEFYYDTISGRLSPKFRNVMDSSRELVAYAIWEEDSCRLAVSHMFDPNLFYREYACNQISGADFAPDLKSIEIEYYDDSGYWRLAKRVFCFETLPILRTTTICYVRTGAGLHNDTYMISSGNPALLRPANGDTVRLLQTVKGGTYTSADGTERDDWHQIVYRGRICYVSADSFVVEQYVVE